MNLNLLAPFYDSEPSEKEMAMDRIDPEEIAARIHESDLLFELLVSFAAGTEPSSDQVFKMLRMLEETAREEIAEEILDGKSS